MALSLATPLSLFGTGNFFAEHRRSTNSKKPAAEAGAMRDDCGLWRWEAGEDRRIMATCGDQHETVPDRIVEAQALPDMKERAD
jgi:hypothetical protein